MNLSPLAKIVASVGDSLARESTVRVPELI